MADRDSLGIYKKPKRLGSLQRGDYRSMVGQRFVAPLTRVQFPLVTPVEVSFLYQTTLKSSIMHAETAIPPWRDETSLRSQRGVCEKNYFLQSRQLIREQKLG